MLLDWEAGKRRLRGSILSKIWAEGSCFCLASFSLFNFFVSRIYSHEMSGSPLIKFASSYPA